MAMLKELLVSHPHFKLVLMSATLQEQMFADYFSCPIVYVKGRTFPVEVRYLPQIQSLVATGQQAIARERGKSFKFQTGKGKPIKKMTVAEHFQAHMTKGAEVAQQKMPKFDAEIVAEVVIRIIQQFSDKKSVPPLAATHANDGSGDGIIVFLSGMQAIERVERVLRSRDMEALNAFVCTLHGSLPVESQRKVFKITRPGEWKVILSTNVAETSVTVDDVTHVLDCGLLKEMRYDATSNVSSLQEVSVSRAAARQRAGRAGSSIKWLR